MSSPVLGSRRTGATGSGGKILRGRRTAAPPATPYLRPNPAPPRPQNNSWFSGLVSGAGKLLSSVFRPSPSPPVSESGSSSSDDDDDSDDDFMDDDDNADDEDNGDVILYKDVEDLDQSNNGVSPASNMEQASGMHRNNAKLAIEELLRQETFSRDECIKLTKIIESRVVDSPTIEGGRLGALSPSASALQAHSFDIRDTAIMEARKWFEEKRMEPSSISEQGNVSEREMSSPVDVAKSYMQAQSPWTSPSLKNVRSNSPVPSGLQQDKSQYAISIHSSASSKVFKRKSLAFGSWDAADETRRVRLKQTDDILEPLAAKQIESSEKASEDADETQRIHLKPTDDILVSLVTRQIESSEKTSENEIVQSPSAADKREVVDINPDTNSSLAAKSAEASTNLPAGSSGTRDGVLHSPDEKFVEEHPSLTAGVDSITENLVPVGNISDSETKVMVSEEANPSDAGGVPDDKDAVQEMGSQVGKTVQSKSFSERYQLSGTEETHSINGSRLQNGDFQMQKEANGSGSGNDASDFLQSSPSAELNGDPTFHLSVSASAELNRAPSPDPSGNIDKNLVDPTHGMLVSSNLEETCKLSSELFTEVPAIEVTDGTVGGVQNGTSSKQEEALPTKRRQKLKPSHGRPGKSTTVKQDGHLQSESGRSSSHGRVMKPPKSKTDGPPKAEPRPNSSRRSVTGTLSIGAAKTGMRGGSARRGRGKGK